MKLISSVNGRATQTFVPDEVRGPRGFYLPQVIDLFKQRYGFLRHSDVNAASEKGMKFEAGRLLIEGGSIAIENLDFYNDGIAAICRDTAEAEAVLNDVFEWGLDAFGARRSKTIMPRTYTSWLVVDFEKPIASMLSKFADIQRLVASSYENAYGKALDFQMLRIAFNADPKVLPLYTQTEYSIDRRGGAEYGLNRFFCAAPLKTDDHIALLSEMEKTFKKAP